MHGREIELEERVSVEEGLVETYRGGVGVWECDAFGHLNIAFYVERFADAAGDLMERHAPGRRWRTLALDIPYEHELRAGEGLAIRSGIIAGAGAEIRLAHAAVNSASGERTTLAEHVIALAPGGGTPAPTALAWPRFPALDLPAAEGTIPTGRDRVRAEEAAAGALSLFGYQRRFSNACLQVLDAIGMTEPYRRAANRGFATFETRLAIADSAAIGDGLVVASFVSGVGNSSLRMVHRMRRALGGRPIATLYQAGVHFDLATRRASPLPPELREAAAALSVVNA
jgi:acyl-CoA thioester hydrolase